MCLLGICIKFTKAFGAAYVGRLYITYTSSIRATIFDSNIFSKNYKKKDTGMVRTFWGHTVYV